MRPLPQGLGSARGWGQSQGLVSEPGARVTVLYVLLACVISVVSVTDDTFLWSCWY